MRAPHRRLTAALAALVAASATAAVLAPAPATAAKPQRPDLTVTGVQTKTFTGAVGSAYKAVATVKNTGKKKAPATRLALQLSRDAKAGNDRLLTSAAVPALAPGKAHAATVQGRLPATLDAGKWLLITCADTGRLAKEKSETNNCRVWRSFVVAATEPEPEPPAPGPMGGVQEVCGGKFRVLGLGTTPPAGLHFAAGPADDGVISHTADGVGFDPDYTDEYSFTRVTITNDGTVPTSFSAAPVVCEYDRERPGYWGILGDDDTEIAVQDRCDHQLLPGDTCQLDIYAYSVRRGGTALPGAIRIIGSTAGQGSDTWALFPIETTSRSRGFLQITPVEADDLLDVPPGQRQYVTYEALNVGDRNAVPTFAIEPSAAFGLGGEPGGWETVGDVPTCTVTYAAGPPQIYTGAIAPGDTCQFRINACSSTGGQTYDAELFARDVFTSNAEVYSPVVQLRYRTSPSDGSPACEVGRRVVARPARPGPAPTVTPTTALAGEAVTVRGKVPTRGGGRPVVLQRKAGNRWATLARRTSSRTGAVSFTVPAAVRTIRLQAPRSRNRTAYTSKARTVRPALPRSVFVGRYSQPDISADGRWVAFTSSAGDDNGFSDVFVWDRRTGLVEQISNLGTLGDANGASSQPSISADGGAVAFSTTATNLVQGVDANGASDVVVWERGAGLTTVSYDENGVQAAEASYAPSIGPDGSTVAFVTESGLSSLDGNGDFDVYVRFRSDGLTRLISGTPSGAGNGPSTGPEISGDGQWIVFQTSATNFTIGDDNGSIDVLRVGLYVDDFSIISRGPGAQLGTGHSSDPSISHDGRFVTFATYADNIAPGSSVVSQVVRYDATDASTRVVSVARDGGPTAGSSGTPSISADGRYVTYATSSGDQVPGDANGTADIVVRDLRRNVTTPVSVDRSQRFVAGMSYSPSISADGRFVVFSSSGRLAPGATGSEGVFVTDRRTPQG